MEDSTMKKSQAECPQTCDNGCEIRNIAFVNYKYLPVEGGVEAEAEDASAVSNTVRTCIVNGTNPDFRIIKSASKEATEPEDIILYTVTVINTGDTVLTGVRISDDLDNISTYIPGSANVVLHVPNGPDQNISSNVTNTDPLVITTIQGLQPNDMFIFSYKVQVNSNVGISQSVDNEVTVRVNEVLEPQLDSQHIPIRYARVNVTKSIVRNTSPSPNCMECGDTFAYRIQLINKGNIAATNVVATDFFDSRFCFDPDDIEFRDMNGEIVEGEDPIITVVNGLLTVRIALLQPNLENGRRIIVPGTICCCDE